MSKSSTTPNASPHNPPPNAVKHSRMIQRQSISAVLICCFAATTAIAEPPIHPGDHIAVVGNTFADQLRIHGYLETLLLQHTSENPVSIRNLGWGGDMLTARDRPTGFPTETTLLTSHKTDVIIACFGMGESFAGEKGVETFEAQLKAFITSHAGKKYNGKSEVRLILVSPIAYEDLGKLTPSRDKRNRNLEVYTRAMRKTAIALDVPFVDLFEVSRYLMDEPIGPQMTSNGIHLNAYGYWAISHSFFDQLTSSDRVPNQQPWLLQINVAKESGNGRGVVISELKMEGSGITFRGTEKWPPKLRPPTDGAIPSQLEFVRDSLVVQNLKPGKYRLTIDGAPIATATAQAWATGVAIDSSPAHKAMEAYRNVANDKNLQFTYSWKALNQVHIVGERKTSPSGKELPGEVIEFEKLAQELDRTLSKGIELAAREWRLVRIGANGEFR